MLLLLVVVQLGLLHQLVQLLQPLQHLFNLRHLVLYLCMQLLLLLLLVLMVLLLLVLMLLLLVLLLLTICLALLLQESQHAVLLNSIKTKSDKPAIHIIILRIWRHTLIQVCKALFNVLLPLL
jgi:hypothetical protein